MDVEKTVEFLLESAARHETQIIAIRNVIEGGMKIVANLQTKTEMLMDAQLRTEDKLQQFMDSTRQPIDKLTAAQTATGASLKAYLDSLNKPRNGHNQGT